jgi:hypothetical protein
MSDELKPCPWCGSEAVYDSFLGYCRCVNDKCLFECKPTAAWITKEGMIRNWNTRPVEDTITAKVERLRKALEELRHGNYIQANWVDTVREFIDAALRGEE